MKATRYSIVSDEELKALCEETDRLAAEVLNRPAQYANVDLTAHVRQIQQHHDRQLNTLLDNQKLTVAAKSYQLIEYPLRDLYSAWRRENEFHHYHLLSPMARQIRACGYPRVTSRTPEVGVQWIGSVLMNFLKCT